LLLGGLLTLLGSWWLSRRVVRPLADLRLAMQRFEREGHLPPAPSSRAPAEVRELAAQFGALARQRQDLDEQRRTMLAAISHDLRSPLGRIRMAAELLPEAEGVAPRRESIVRNVQLTDRLLGSFIDMARAEDERIRGRVDLAALVLGVTQGEPDWTLAELPQHPVWLQPASAVALERTLRNLMDNARLHGSPPLELSLSILAGQAQLTVRDHGQGIAPHLLHEVLQPFVRGESSRHQPGTGLGLAIVQRTVLRHGGRLQMVDAQPGLRVELSFPLELT
jgi:two-component system, OmpR family, osmolarity sensor histidine kinase EnvZ